MLTHLLIISVLSVLCYIAHGQIEGGLRLIGTNTSTAGRLEIFHAGSWGLICDDLFHHKSGVVACRQLGYVSATVNIICCGKYETPGQTRKYWLDDVDCTGKENTLAECKHQNWGDSNCSAHEEVGIECTSSGPCTASKCLHGGRCVDIDSQHFQCLCTKHFHGAKCENDTNECENNQICSHTCVNTFGSYECKCPEGMEIGSDNKTCQDINECLTGHHNCSHLCANTNGSYVCTCPDIGMSLGSDNKTCHDVSEPNAVLTCSGTHMKVELSKTTYLGIHEDYIHLNDPTCNATGNSTHVIIMVPLDGCLTKFNETNHIFVYENTVLSRNITIENEISRVREVKIPLICEYSKRMSVTSHYRVNTDKLSFTQTEMGTFHISLDLFHNTNFTRITDGTFKTEPGETMYVQVSANTSTSVHVYTLSCGATATANENTSAVYGIITNGCVKDTTLRFLVTPTKTLNHFTLESFKFVNNAPSVYIHCKVLVCNASLTNSRCNQGCIKTGTATRLSQNASPPLESAADDVILSRRRRDAMSFLPFHHTARNLVYLGVTSLMMGGFVTLLSIRKLRKSKLH